LNFKIPNPQIDFENSPFYVNTGLKTWESNENPLRAGVSSFGLGGTNVHVVLEEAPPVGKSVNQWVSESVRKAPEGTRGLAPLSNRQYRLILLSAKTSTALDKMSENLARHFERHSHLELTEAAYTLQVGRRPFAYRKMLVCSDLEEAARKLEASEVETAAAKEEKHTVIFMFSGQGSQYVNMGYDLYKNAPMFRRQIDECFELLANIIGIDMKSVLYPGEGAPALEEAGEKIFRFKYATPIKFIFEYSLAKMLLKWGIRPDAMIGHSFGEYAAACLSGVFSLEHGIFLAALRGELMDGLVDGAMLGVPLSEKELKQQWVKEELSIAAVNGESLCVVSGPVEAVNRLEEQLNLEGYECLRFQVPKAGHSRMVEPIMEEFKKKIGKVKFHKPRIPFISCISGTWITAEEAVDPGYWTRHLREPVRFADGLTTLFKEPNPVFLQASPGQGLILFINRHPDKKSDTLALSMVRHRKEPVSDVHHTLTQIGRLWLKGCETGMNWQAFYQGEKRRRIPLPAYPFEPIHYPVNKDLFKPGTPVIPSFSKETGPSGLRKKTDTAEWFYVPSWERVMQPRDAAISKGEQPHKTPFILLFMDNRGLGPTLKERLEQGSAAVITVDMGIDFKKSHDRAYTINPTEKENYNDLLRDLASRGEMPTRVYHLWSLSRRDRDKPAKDNVNKALDRGFYSLLFLVRALGKQNVETGQGVRLEVVTGGALEVNGDEELYPESAPVYGLCRVIPQEYPEIHCRCIDITLPRGDVIGEKQVRQLWSEFSSVSPDRVTAYRGNYRWVETFKPFRLEKNQPGALPLKQGGVYVITGGLGAIALVLAQYLAKTFKARLILTGRSDFPPRQEWGREKASRKVQRLMEMEKAGAEVLVMKADVSSLDRMQAVFQQGEEKFGPINGVIHAAGIVGEKSFCPLKDMGKKEAQLHFEPKVYGLLVLEEILKNRPMDFCLLMSSTASVLGGLGFGAYSAANRFMDAYIYRLARSGRTRWISVNWDGWQLEEKQIEDTALGAEIKELAMTPQEGVEVFQRILAWPEARQVIECTGDLQSRIHRWVKMQGPQVPDQEKETGGKKPGLVLRQPRPHLSNPYIPPRSSREKQVAGIWEELLRYEHIGLQDNFFELNGDSLKAVIAISKIHKQAGVKVPLKDFFAHPTVEEIARYIVRAEGSMYDSIQPVEKKEYYPISSAQQGMFILHRYEKERKSTAYNIPVVMELTGELDRETFLTVFQELIRRHESLRTSFLMIEDKPVQRIHDEVEVKVEEVTGKRRIEGWKGRRVEEEKEGSQRIEGTGGLAPMSIEPAANTVKNFIRPFDLSQAPLLRIGLIKKETQTHILMLDIHHIVSDGVSMGILVREFIPLYEGGKLPALSIRYKDFSAWQNQWFRSPKSKEQEDYWLNRLKGDIPVLKMKTDFPRPAVKHFEGDCLALEIDEKLTGKVKQMMSKTGTTFFQVLLAAYSILISKYTRQQDIIVGVPIAGRGHVDLESIIGMFVNTLAIRIHQRKDLGFLEFLAEVKKRLLEAYENQDYPLEELVKKLDIPKDLSRNPLFDVLFVSENLDIPKLAAKDLEFHPYEFENKITHLDLVLYFVEIGNKIRMKLEYSTGLFKDETVRTMLEHYIEIVEQIVDNREICIKDIRLSHDFSPAHSTVLPETQIEFSF
jgi:polyketide synthase PksJ